jgi:hypothetical protein
MQHGMGQSLPPQRPINPARTKAEMACLCGCLHAVQQRVSYTVSFLGPLIGRDKRINNVHVMFYRAFSAVAVNILRAAKLLDLFTKALAPARKY